MSNSEEAQADPMSDKPASAASVVDLNNQSTTTVTTVSTEKDNDVFSTANSPVTSPVLNIGDNGLSHASDKGVDGRDALEHNFTESVLSKSNELVSLMKSLTDATELKEPKLQLMGDKFSENPDEFDWKAIIELAENIFEDYSKKMEQVTNESEELNREFLIWQESVYIMDSEKVSRRLGDQETWLSQKKQFLNYQKKELSNSAELIDNALKNLRPGDKNKERESAS